MSAPKIVEEKYYRFSNYSDKIYNPKVRLAVEMAFDAGCNMVRVMKHLEDVDSEYEITIDTPEFSIHAFGDIWVFRVSAKFFDGRDYFSARRVIDCDDEMLKAVFKGMRAEAQVSQYLISYLSDNPDFHLSLYTVGETLVKGWDGDVARVKITGNDSKYDINHVEVEIIGPGGSSIDFETTDSIFYLDLWRTITDAFMIQENSFGDIEVSGGNWYGCFSIENDDTLLSYSITDKYDEVTIDGIYGVRTISSTHPVDDIIMLISRDIFRVKAMEYFITYIDESFIRKSLISDRSVVCQVEEGMKVEIFGISRVIGSIEFDDHDISSAHVVVNPEGERPLDDDEEDVISNVRVCINAAISEIDGNL